MLKFRISVQDTMKRVRRQDTGSEEIFIIPITAKGFVTRIYNSYKLIRKKQKPQLKMNKSYKHEFQKEVVQYT